MEDASPILGLASSSYLTCSWA